MSDLEPGSHDSDANVQPLFRAALESKWDTLPEKVRALHHVVDVAEFKGFADIERGTRPLGKLCAVLFRFPRAGLDVPVTVTKIRTKQGETWQRQFGKRIQHSRLKVIGPPFRVTEQYWPFTFELALSIRNDTIRLPVRRGWLLGIPIPKRLLPKSDSREFLAGGSFHFDIKLRAPLRGGLIVRYRGTLRPVKKPIADTPRSNSATAQP